jgi:hypothetical protein
MTRLMPALLAVAPLFPCSPSPCRAEDATEALAAVQKLGATVLRDEQDPGKPVTAVVFTSRKPVTDADLQHLRAFPKLRTLALGGSGKVTAKGLATVGGLKGLEDLSLSGVKAVTDESLKNLAKLSNLQRLDLSLTGVGDKGLKHLTGLKRLLSVTLTLTQVTPQGVQDLQRALPKAKIVR